MEERPIEAPSFFRASCFIHQREVPDSATSFNACGRKGIEFNYHMSGDKGLRRHSCY